MKRESVFLMFFLIILVASSFAVVGVPRVEASGTVYIRADGSIDPPTAPIYTADNVTYTLTGNITSDAYGIIVERDNIVVDGSGFAIEGMTTAPADGIYLDGRSNVTIQNTNIMNFYEGIWLDSSSNNSINGNTITNNIYYGYGIELHNSSNNSIRRNTITNNSFDAIELHDYSNYNSISENTITNNSDHCILLVSSSNYNSINGNNITNNSVYGIWLGDCSNISISGNNITANGWFGIRVGSSSNNSLNGNTITNNYAGIVLLSSSNSNRISGNDIINNSWFGIRLGSSSNNTVFHNNLINNTASADDWIPDNFWDDGYPSGGNYWSDYNGTDANHDGIGDTPYVIDANNTDNYPLMGTFHEFTVTDGMLYNIATVSNFTILELDSLHELRLDGSWYLVLEINAVIPKDTVGFCRIDIPRALIDGPYHVLTLGGNFTPTELPISNSSHALLYFTFDHSGPVIIVPEFPSFLILPLVFTTTLLAVIIYRRKRR